jgi:hypothetical protein
MRTTVTERSIPVTLREQCDTGDDEPERPGDVGGRGEALGDAPAGALVPAGELEPAAQ